MDPPVAVTGMVDDAAMLAALLACFAAVYSSWAFLILSTQFCAEEKHNPNDRVDKMEHFWDSLGQISEIVICHFTFTSMQPLWLQGCWSSLQQSNFQLLNEEPMGWKTEKSWYEYCLWQRLNLVSFSLQACSVADPLSFPFTTMVCYSVSK